jgi:hypothetical protein
MTLSRHAALAGIATIDQAEADGLLWLKGLDGDTVGEMFDLVIRISRNADPRLAAVGILAQTELKRLCLMEEGIPT